MSVFAQTRQRLPIGEVQCSGEMKTQTFAGWAPTWVCTQNKIGKYKENNAWSFGSVATPCKNKGVTVLKKAHGSFEGKVKLRWIETHTQASRHRRSAGSSLRFQIPTQMASSVELLQELTIGAEIVVFIHYFMLVTISGQPCTGARWLGPIRYPHLFHSNIKTQSLSYHKHAWTTSAFVH